MRQVVAGRRVRVNGELWLDPARRLKAGDTVEMLGRPEKLPEAFTEDLVVRHLDGHVAVVEKPPGINTVRHPTEIDWKDVRRGLSPTLEDRLQLAIAARLRQPGRDAVAAAQGSSTRQADQWPGRLCPVRRGRAGTRPAVQAHTVDRQYIAVVPGHLVPGTIRTWLVRDRGDGRRGSSRTEGIGKLAITHLVAVEPLGEIQPRDLPAGNRADAPDSHSSVRAGPSGLRRPGLPHSSVTVRGFRTTAAPHDWLCTPKSSDSITRRPAKRLRWEMPPPADLRQFIERISTHGNQVDR